MKSARFMLSMILLCLSTAAFAQTEAQNTNVQKTDAQKSFDEIKTLSGNWEGAVTTDPPMKDMGNGATVQVSLRVTSRGNAIMHEMKDPATPDDPTRYDHPVTMLYLDNGHLLLTHYCDAGNRPRMTARTSPDGKTVDFDFLDVAGSTEYGHMQHAMFTTVDANHHIEEWTYLMPGDKPLRARIDLKRTK